MTLHFKTLAVAGLIFAALYSVGCKKQPTMAKLPSDAVILAFGDSLTYGTGASRGNDYPSVLTQLTSMQVINSGVPGEISQDGLKRLPEVLDEYHPQLLILAHGGNDMLRKIPRTVTSENLKQMIALAKQRNIPLLLLGVPQPGLFLLETAEMYKQVAEQEGVPINLDVLAEIIADNDLKADVVHPNDAGYRKLAEEIAETLREEGAL